MADINNFSDINDNFDTIKTLLNSIRAQGILNTSDVDKLLSGINTKLEKINTEEDIDLIKTFLSELKQNLDERHSVLISKFGAIESLFSNLLKNSADTLKTNDVKEMFDIVATNLSVFSREVVSQKETLTDITLRLDAMRSDDTQKKDIIKNISVLRTDIEHLSNGFDSIVLSLNENFKTVVKTISGIDQSETIAKFGSQIEDIVNSSNTILSALQLMDKKNTQIEDLIGDLATKEDINSTKKDIAELVAQNRVLTDSIDSVTEKAYKIDSLSEKIDASVNIIAGLKSVISESDEQVSSSVKERLDHLEKVLREVTSDKEFEAFKATLEALLRRLSDGSDKIHNIILAASEEVKQVNAGLKALDLNTSFRALESDMNKLSDDVKEHVTNETGKVSQLLDANITRTLNDISSNADILNSHIKDTQTAISELCEKSFVDVMDGISGLKFVVAQIDENSVSANNAIFANISDRLAIFENSLKNSLDKQEDFVSNSSSRVVEQVAGISNIAGNIDYKLDTSLIEINNSKSKFEELKASIDGVLALDFVNVVQGLRTDLYAVKQELSDAVENSSGDLADKFSGDLLSKYELLISRLDNAEDEIKAVQKTSLDDLKGVLEKISSSIVDVLSYVSTAGDTNTEALDSKLNEIAEVVKDSNLNYVENVRDVVDVIRTQVRNNLEQIEAGLNNKVDSINSVVEKNNDELKQDIKNSYDKLVEVQTNFDAIKESLKANNNTLSSNMSEILETAGNINSVVEKNNDELKQDIKNSYDKLVEVQTNFDALKESLNVNNITLSSNMSEILESAGSIKTDFEAKMTALKNSLLDNVSEFKKEFTCENADKISEIKFNSENLHSKAIQASQELKNELRDEINTIIDSLKSNISELEELTSKTALKIEGANKEIVDYIKNDFCMQVNSSVDTLKSNVSDSVTELSGNISDVVKGFTGLESAVNNLSSETTTSLNATLAKILENFVALKSVVNNAEELQQANIKQGVEQIREDFAVLRNQFETADNQIDEDLAKQISIIESNFDSLNTLISDLFKEGEVSVGSKIENGLNDISERVGITISSQLEQYKAHIEELFDRFKEQGTAQSNFIKERALELNSILQVTLEAQDGQIKSDLEEISSHLKSVLDESIEISNSDYASLKERLIELTSELAENNNNLVNSVKEQVDEITKFVNSGMEIQSQETSAMYEEISSSIQKMASTIRTMNGELDEKMASLKSSMTDFEENASSILENNSINYVTQLENSNSQIIDKISAESQDLKTQFETLNARLDKDELSQMNVYQSQFNELSKNFNDFIDKKVGQKLDSIMSTNIELSSNQMASLEGNTAKILDEIENAKNNTTVCSDIIKKLVQDECAKITDVFTEEKVGQKLDSIITTNLELSSNQMASLESYADKILDEIEIAKNNATLCNDIIKKLVQDEITKITKEIEKETDVIVGDILEQFGLLKDEQKDNLNTMVSQIEGSVAGYILDSVNDIKSYLDVKTDSTIINSKIDSLRNELENTANGLMENISRLLEVTVFTGAISEIKTTNEVLITTAADKLNSQITEFITNNVSRKFDEKINLFDKKFIDTLVDKFEEVKILSTGYNSSFERISTSVQELISKFVDTKTDITKSLESTVGRIYGSINDLSQCFADLKSQILNKSFDETFQSAINHQIGSIENLVSQQMNYLEDISELCSNNLPELTEMNALIKYSIKESIADLTQKLDSNDFSMEQSLAKLKADIITQFINVFNQISFVAEQEEILDFIQEKHSELITVLSHIVTSVDDVEKVKDNIAVVDNKIDTMQEDIDLINEKITAIMSSDGNVEYVYSLQDLESDIANLRIVLNDMKERVSKFGADDLKQGFESIAEDIVSISTRTNKLLLATDESHKALQDNLQDFKLVINDLDERTKNFAHESGMDIIDRKLGSLNTMMKQEAQTNQVFNQVFEYLAEWVDKAGTQISAISERVETLNDIGQIRVMLEDLRAQSADNSESEELVDALGKVFEKQAKRISSLEAKLDRVIVENNINNKNNKIDMSPMEDTLNRFLAAMDDKMMSQQDKINSLESKLEEVMSLVDNKDTAQLTKKVGGMDRQIAKLNKSIEKIASHVVEK